MARYVRSSSKGLAELTRSSEPTVQFIHESVRDYLLKEDGLLRHWPELGDDFQCFSHDRLKCLCQDYLNTESAFWGTFFEDALPRPMSDEASHTSLVLTTRLPLLEYASRNMLYHANKAARKVPQQDFLRNLAIRPLLLINNIILAVKDKAVSYPYQPDTTLLYMLAEKNLANLIRLICPMGMDFDFPGDGRHNPFIVAFDHACWGAIHALLRLDSSQRAQTIMKSLEQARAVKRLPWGEGNFTMIAWAAGNGQEHFVRHLIDHGAGIDPNALPAASFAGHEDIVQLLLNLGTDINAHGEPFGTAVYAAAQQHHERVLRLLLDNGVVIDGSSADQGSALQAAVLPAVSKGLANLDLLLERGANVNVQGGNFGNALQEASYWGSEVVVQMLLDRGANVDAEGGEYGSAIQAAHCKGHDGVVKLLLEAGATDKRNEIGPPTVSELSCMIRYEGH
ncbi:hypothetical protein LTR56_003024 [Elasticomyces elasticus]|nr:hypothetical protein LTR56_003024 [Elasticomyces elasticus]KAK3662087.1 hypothetical protein LTR22_007059 [Elasticomyces elasticus]KAK4927550.1 hypothetical protein LTR49_005691 [Elasticomyces elasticus]KAK5753237.1 hypothetical protein LTS12_016704 [Elasticomyces elasticus]